MIEAIDESDVVRFLFDDHLLAHHQANGYGEFNHA
jgi:hypothetical protein